MDSLMQYGNPSRLMLIVALGAICLGPTGCCGPGETPQPPPPDASAQIRVLETGGWQGGMQASFERRLHDCEQAIEELLAMGPGVVPQIADALRALPPDTDGSWLGEALFAFGEDAAPAGEAVLSRLVLGTNTAGVMAAVLDVSGPEGQKLLVRALSPDHPEACLVFALGQVEVDSDAEALAVVRLFDHQSADVREEAVLCLWGSGEWGRSQLGVIRRAFQDQSGSVRRAAVGAAASVAVCGDSVTANALGELLLRENERGVVRDTIEALLSIKAGTPTVRRGLEHVVGGGDKGTRTMAAAALRELLVD